MKIFFIIFLLILATVLAGLMFLSLKSKSGTAPGLVNGRLSACPDKPNCVSSEKETPEAQAVEPFSLEIWDALPDRIAAAGGVVTVREPEYIAAEFTSKLFRYVDDIEFRKADDVIHVRSASRVGYRDLGVNRKRVETLRKAKTD